MSKCSICKKDIGILNKVYHCCICNKLICSNCISKEKQIINPIFNNYTAHEWAKYITYSCEDLIPNLHYYGFWGNFIAFCPHCFSKYLHNVSLIRNIIESQSYNDVRLFSSNYQGRTPNHTQQKIIETSFYRNKKDAENHLKILAKFYNCKTIINVHYTKNTEEEPSNNGNGTHLFTIFKYKGIAIS